MKPRLKRRGSSIFIVFGIISVLFIFGVSFVYITSNQTASIRMMEARIKARLLAESAVEKAISRLESQFLNELVHMEKDATTGDPIFEINTDLLDLIDIDRLAGFSKVMRFEPDELMVGGQAVVVVEVRDVISNDFSTFIDFREKIPDSLKVHQKPRNALSVIDLEPLGGIQAKVRLRGHAYMDGISSTVEMAKTFRVTDISPPAPDHTLFLHSNKEEVLKEGSFVLSNLDLPPIIQKLLKRMSRQVEDALSVEVDAHTDKARELIENLNNALSEGFKSESLEESIALIDEISKVVSDDTISETVDNIILSLNPRNWGRVRTNGRLEVYMPFFAADDIINYFAESGGWRDLPEVGYLFHDNRLHDPYMSVYTHYEGLVYKRYRKIYPAHYGIVEPEEVAPEQYTINTLLEYPRRYPQHKDVENLERLRANGINVATFVFDKRVRLIGTASRPLELDGIWYFREGVQLGGPYTGRGMIVSDKQIVVEEDLTKVYPKDTLSMVSLNAEVVLAKSGELKVESAIYAQEGLARQGTRKVDILGNLAVENLNREAAPSDIYIRFDADIKNHMVDNLHGLFADDWIYWRNLARDNRVIMEQGYRALPEIH